MCSKLWLAAVTFIAMQSAACAHRLSSAVADPVRARATDFGSAELRAAAGGRPIILEFHAGDRIPVELMVDGEVITTDPPTTSVTLQAKQAFFLRLQGKEIKTSLDGTSFDARPAAPGAFRIGLESAPQGGPLLTVHLTTPVHARR